MGRILIVNTLCASLYVYKCSVLPLLDATHVRKFNLIVNRFIWNGGRTKISREKLENPKELGGLKLVNLVKKDLSLKCQWVAYTREFDHVNILSKQFFPHICSKIWLCNISPRDVVKNFPYSFWRDVLEAWAVTNWHSPVVVTKIAAQPLWYNSHLKIKNKVIFNKRACDAGIFLLSDIWNLPEGQFLTYQQITQVYGNNISYLEYFSLIASIPLLWKTELRGSRFVLETFLFPYENCEGRTSADTYNKLISNKTTLQKLVHTWEIKLGLTIELNEFLENFSDLYTLAYSTKL